MNALIIIQVIGAALNLIADSRVDQRTPSWEVISTARLATKLLQWALESKRDVTDDEVDMIRASALTAHERLADLIDQKKG